MAGIIWLVVIMYIVIKCVNASKKNAKQTKPNVPRQSAPKKQQKQLNRTNNRTSTSASAGSWNNLPAQRQQTRSSQKAAARPAQENSILQKAKANASQQFADDTLQARGRADLDRVPLGDEIMKDKAKARHIHSEHETGHENELQNQPGVDDFDTYHLIDEVNDLIVKGYSGNLEFERDFLSEATDMLNRMYG